MKRQAHISSQTSRGRKKGGYDAYAIPNNSGTLLTLKRLIWLYFWLLIFEGALRKWIVPGLSTPLLVVRDPVVLAIYFFAIERKLMPINGLLLFCYSIGILNIFSSTIVGTPLMVTMYGFRCNFLHAPLIYLIPLILDKDDILKFGKAILLIAIPMCLLTMYQFKSDATHWVNTSAGGQGAQMLLGDGKVRAAGTFSFNTGLWQFFSIATAFVIFAFISKKYYNRLLLYILIPFLPLALSMSGSRGALVASIMVLGCSVLGAAAKGKNISGIFSLFIIGGVALFFVSSSEFNEDARALIGKRFDSGGGIKEGIVDRTFGEVLNPLRKAFDHPLLGKGLGASTRAGVSLSGGKVERLWVENEFDRILAESGSLLGSAFILFRLLLFVDLAKRAYRSLKLGNYLAFGLFAAAAPIVLNGQWAQPTTLGFASFTAGLFLAASNTNICITKQSTSPQISRNSMASYRKRFR